MREAEMSIYRVFRLTTRAGAHACLRDSGFGCMLDIDIGKGALCHAAVNGKKPTLHPKTAT